MTKLTDLNAEFIALGEDPDSGSFRRVKTLGEAQGIMFQCPKCFSDNGNSCG